ncbi:hypothetical protein GCM10009850_043860 [Nonomuraea monospora]|uniref:Uncharacterized protein n=1 Tax=Nonomuraea monospora TaxID=568818 RepID=A0ABN3CHN2_9ACTN
MQTVEIHRNVNAEPQAQVFLFGVDLFATPPEQVIAELRTRYEVEVERNDGGLVVPRSRTSSRVF